MERKNRVFFILVLGIVPALGFSSDVRSALLLSIATVVGFYISRAVSYPLTKKSGEGVSFLTALLVNIFVFSALMMLLEAFLYDVYKGMEIYFALNAVSGTALLSSSDRDLSLKESMADVTETADMFSLLVILSAVIREVFGSGSFYGIEIGFMKNHLIPLLIKPQGGFFTLGIILALLKGTYKKEETSK